MKYLRHVMILLVSVNLGLSLYLLEKEIVDPVFYAITLAAVILLATVTLCDRSNRSGRQRMLLGSSLYSGLMLAGALLGQSRDADSLLIVAMLGSAAVGGIVCYRIYRRNKMPKYDPWSAYFR